MQDDESPFNKRQPPTPEERYLSERMAVRDCCDTCPRHDASPELLSNAGQPAIIGCTMKFCHWMVKADNVWNAILEWNRAVRKCQRVVEEVDQETDTKKIDIGKIFGDNG